MRVETCGGDEALNFYVRTDTFFLATAAFEMSEAPCGADMSHRGGPAGFVKVAADGKSVRWADYKGNSMYMSLGNITHNSGISLLFVDYEKGSSVHAEGHARCVHCSSLHVVTLHTFKKTKQNKNKIETIYSMLGPLRHGLHQGKRHIDV